MLIEETPPGTVGTGAAVTGYTPVPVPDHLPEKLTITLWDFSWYVRSGVGEPFEDLDRAFAEAVDRGYNTVRICAMPFLLFGSGLDTSAVSLDRLGGGYGQGVRWYDVGAPTTFDGRALLVELFEAARRHGVYVILSSWEYQQSPAFSVDRRWYDSLIAVDPELRAERLAESLSDLIDFLTEHGLDDRIAFTELHNEVQWTRLTDGLRSDDSSMDDVVVALKPRLSRGLARFHQLQPERLATVNYSRVPFGAMRGIPDQIDVLVTHPYIYGVLDEVTVAFNLRGALADFDKAAADAAGLLRPDAPEPTDWTVPVGSEWKLDATIVGKPEIYLHDWVDADAFDRYLYERYGDYRYEMLSTLRTWIAIAADYAAARGIPCVFGEGWVGYTPLRANFEEGPVGAEFCREAMRESRRIDAWGSIVCSNAAPQHPMWADVALQRECNTIFARPDQLTARSTAETAQPINSTTSRRTS
jgi:hypothetical protein